MDGDEGEGEVRVSRLKGTKQHLKCTKSFFVVIRLFFEGSCIELSLAFFLLQTAEEIKKMSRMGTQRKGVEVEV